MAKKKAAKKSAKKETKSDFLRRVLSRNPNLEHRQVNQRWAKAGNDGTISEALYYVIRRELGIVTVWVWEQAPGSGSLSGGPRISKGTGLIYQLKVTLAGLNPPVWRRVEVRDVTLNQLHEILQVVMGWTDSHLHQFIVGETYYGQPFPDGFGPEMEDETDVLLSQIVDDGKTAQFIYEYDFGDSWGHEIVLERTSEPEPKIQYPRCLDGARACPPEDCGGIWGYVDFLAAMVDPRHENHREMKEWIGGKFDPERFSVDLINRHLKSLR